MIPKYPYLVYITYRVGMDKQQRQTKSFETIGAAVACRDAALKRQLTTSVSIHVILDEAKKETIRYVQ